MHRYFCRSIITFRGVVAAFLKVLIFCFSDFQKLRSAFISELLQGLHNFLPLETEPVIEELETYRGTFYLQLMMKIERIV